MGFWSDLFPGWLGEFTDAYFTGYQYIDTANSEAEIGEVTKQKIDALTSEYLRRLNPEIPGDFVGNEMLAALPIGLGRQIGRIETWRDKDWFAIPVLKGFDYTISLFPKDSEGSIPIDGWLHAAVYDADGKELEWRQPSQYGNPTEINYSSENDGAIFMRMSPYYPYYYGDYEVDIAATRTSVNTGTGVASDITGNGAFQEGVTLTAPVVTGDPDGDATNPNYAYQWFKGNTAITNATASTYAVPASGAGTYKVAVTYTDAQGFTATVDSPEQVVSTFNNGNGNPASITGNGAFKEGVTLTAPVVTGDPDGDALNPNYSYQWFKGSTAITNATASTYAVPASGAGTYKVAVTYTDAQGFIATVSSPEQDILTGIKILDSSTGATKVAGNDGITDQFALQTNAAPSTPFNISKFNPADDFLQIPKELAGSTAPRTFFSVAKVVMPDRPLTKTEQKLFSKQQKAVGKSVKRIGTTGDRFAYNQLTGQLFLDTNGKKKGFGVGGGLLAVLEDTPAIGIDNFQFL